MEIEHKELVCDLREAPQFPSVIGLTRDGQTIWTIAGAAPNDDDADDDADDSDDDADDDDKDDKDDDADDDADDSDDDADDDDKDDDEKDKKKPADKKLTPEEERAKRGVVRERERRKAAERKLAAERQKNESDQEKAAREATEAAEARYKPVAVKASARALLSEAGWKGDTARAVRMMNLDDVDVDDDGEVAGLEEEIDKLREEFPDLFRDSADDADDDDDEDETAKKRRERAEARRRRGRPDNTRKAGKKPEPKTSAERLAAQAGFGPKA